MTIHVGKEPKEARPIIKKVYEYHYINQSRPIDRLYKNINILGFDLLDIWYQREGIWAD